MTSSDLHRYGQADKTPEHIKEVNLLQREKEREEIEKLDKPLISKRDWFHHEKLPTRSPGPNGFPAKVYKTRKEELMSFAKSPKS